MGMFDSLRRLGPGLITGAADDDPSGIATYSQAGAQFGTSLMWTMVLTYPLMVAVQLASAHVGRVTGHGLAHSLRQIMPRWLVIGLVVLLFIANTINIGADLAAMGEASAMVTHGGKHWFTIAFALGSLLLQVYVPYHRYAAWLKWMTLVLLSYVTMVFIVKIDWHALAIGLFVPHIAGVAAVTTVVAMLGTTISPYLFFWQASQEVEDLDQNKDRKPLLEAAEQADKAYTACAGIRSPGWRSRISSRWRSSWRPPPRCTRRARPISRAPPTRRARSSRSPAISHSRCSASASSAPGCWQCRC